MRVKYFAIAAVLLITLSQCKKPASKNDLFNNYDQQTLLNNIGNNILVPAIDSFATSSNAMQNAINVFVATPNTTTLTAAQSAFTQLALNWAAVEPFNFGPMTDNLWSPTINTWPIDTAKIQAAINTQASAATQGGSAKGLKTLEYLLYDKNGNQAVLDKYTGSSASNMKAYLSSVMGQVTFVATGLQTAWVGSGNYLNTFLTAKGNYVSSSVSLLINSIAYFIDADKNNKVGAPIGMSVKVNDNLPHPELIEYPLSELSIPAIKLNVQNMQRVFTGGTTGPGLNNLLDYVKAQQDGQNLSTIMGTDFTDAITKINGITPPYAAATSNQTQQIKLVYTALKVLIANTEVNVANNLGVAITFTDTDGD